MTSLRPYPSYHQTDLPRLAQIPVYQEIKAKIKTLEKEIMDMLREVAK